LAGAVAALIGTIILALNKHGGDYALFPYIIFGVSMTLLFSASAVYHLVSRPEKLIRVCHIIDHSMIYVFIAGTYTPIVSFVFEGALKWGYIIGIWAFALCGIILKAFFTGRFRLFSTIVYLVMGWSIVFAVVPLVKSMPVNGTVLLFTGGVLYTLGGIIYAAKKPELFSKFGFHELFHIFMLLGAVAHYFMVFFFLGGKS